MHRVQKLHPRIFSQISEVVQPEIYDVERLIIGVHKRPKGPGDHYHHLNRARELFPATVEVYEVLSIGTLA